MLKRKECHGDMADIHVYTAKKLEGMADSLENLARTFDGDGQMGQNLSREDGLAALQMASAMVCGDCAKCNLYSDSQREDSYYLYYLLRAFEQNGSVGQEDMPRLFQETCRKQADYVGQLNRNLGRATMNLSWKNRFLESRDVVISSFVNWRRYWMNLQGSFCAPRIRHRCGRKWCGGHLPDGIWQLNRC